MGIGLSTLPASGNPKQDETQQRGKESDLIIAVKDWQYKQPGGKPKAVEQTETSEIM